MARREQRARPGLKAVAARAVLDVAPRAPLHEAAAQVVEQHAPRHAVDHRVMRGQQQPAAARAIARQRRHEQRPAGKPHGAPRGGEQRLRARAVECLSGMVVAHQARAVLARCRRGEFCPPARRVAREAQAQRVVVGHQRIEPCLEKCRRELGRHVQQPRLLVVIHVPVVDREERVMDRQQGHVVRTGFRGALARAAVRRVDRLVARVGGQQFDAREAEQVTRRKGDALLARARRHLDRQDRIAPQLEEIVGHAERRGPQHRAPDLPQRPLGRVARGERAAGIADRVLQRQRGERAAIELARDALGQRRHEAERARHHVVGQARPERRRQRLARGRRVGRALARRERDVRHQLRAAVIVAAHRHGRLRDQRMGVQGRLDLVELDAVAADLDLLVDAPQELDLAVVRPAREVSRQVELAARGERIRQEALAR